MNTIIPKIIFIIPYRDRQTQYKEFKTQMNIILEDYDEKDYKILYIHQTDQRSFNRGAMKNIGFIFVKNMYPKDYKNITLVFNDIDTLPTKKNLIPYNTQKGVVKHFYGFDYALGGIFSIKAEDFEKVKGFLNLWTWGYEDNNLNQRVLKAGLKIDRNVFFKGKDENIIHKLDNGIKTINKVEFDKYAKNINDGIHTIYDLKYEYEETTGFVNIITFNVSHDHIQSKDVDYDLREGLAPFKRGPRQPIMKMFL
jgi:hypothetical protein